eukprot:767745-Hanusia_phi.AAC.1
MKFGQRMRAEEAACLLGNRLELADRFVNYKCLKKLIKPLTAQSDYSSREGHEQTFVRALLNEINQVNDFFVNKESEYCDYMTNKLGERVRTIERKKCGGDGFRADPECLRTLLSDIAAFAVKVQNLRRYAIVNALAVVKITKKHDKHSLEPLQPKVIKAMEDFAFFSSSRFPGLLNSTESLLERFTNRPKPLSLTQYSKGWRSSSPAGSVCSDDLSSPQVMTPLGPGQPELNEGSSLSMWNRGMQETDSLLSGKLQFQPLTDAALRCHTADSPVLPSLKDSALIGSKAHGTINHVSFQLTANRDTDSSRSSHDRTSSLPSLLPSLGGSQTAADVVMASSSRIFVGDSEDGTFADSLLTKNSKVEILEVKPRLRRRSWGQGGKQALGGRPLHDMDTTIVPVKLSTELLRQHFDMPLNDAARKLGICATAIKKVSSRPAAWHVFLLLPTRFAARWESDSGLSSA